MPPTKIIKTGSIMEVKFYLVPHFISQIIYHDIDILVCLHVSMNVRGENRAHFNWLRFHVSASIAKR